MTLQRIPEWYAAKLGKASASRIADVVARTKTGYSTSRQNYAAELIVERLTGRPTNGYTSPAMQWGIDHEDEAKAVYADRLGFLAVDAPFIDHPEIAWSGASPDGFVETTGLIEVKCPLTATHIATLLGAEIEGGHLTQMQWQMACTGRLWCDYVSFDPRLPERMQFHCRRVHRDLSRILELEAEVSGFLVEVADKVDALTAIFGEAEAA